MVQVSPADAGVVSPSEGIHKIPINETVVLSATPRPGYRFLYWLGDVTAADAPQTTTVIGGPKIVVAVFEKAQFDMLPAAMAPADNSGRSAQVVRRQVSRQGNIGFSGPGAVQNANGSSASAVVNPIDLEDWIVGPGSGDEDEVPGPGTPEPGTITLLALGAAILGTKRRRRFR